MKVLVTGACGQLGTALRQIAPEGWLFTDIADGFPHLDITDSDAVRSFVAEHGVDAIVNCAGYTNVEAAEDNQEAAMLLNGTAPGILASVIKERGGLIVHISTDYVFDGKGPQVPIREDATPAPLSVYGQSKLKGEEAVLASGADSIIFRTAWLYSPWGKNFVKTIIGLTSSRDSIKVVSDQFGTPTYAPDLAAVILVALEKYASGAPCLGVFNYTDEGVATWYDFALEIARQSGNTSCAVTPCNTGEFPTKAARPAWSVLDKTLVKRTFGVSIPSWEESLAICMSNM